MGAKGARRKQWRDRPTPGVLVRLGETLHTVFTFLSTSEMSRMGSSAPGTDGERLWAETGIPWG